MTFAEPAPPPPSQIRAAIRAVLERTPQVRFGLLFGSRAAGRARPGSDWDVAAFLDPALSTEARFATRLRLAAELEEAAGTADLVVLNDAPPLLAHRCLRGERLLVRDKTAYVEFFVRILSQVEDEERWAEIHRVARRKRLEEGRFGR